MLMFGVQLITFGGVKYAKHHHSYIIKSLGNIMKKITHCVIILLLNVMNLSCWTDFSVYRQGKETF